MAPSAKPLPTSTRVEPVKLAPLSVRSLSVGTICTSTPELSRARRTRPVVALTGTAALRVWAATSTLTATVMS